MFEWLTDWLSQSPGDDTAKSYKENLRAREDNVYGITAIERSMKEKMLTTPILSEIESRLNAEEAARASKTKEIQGPHKPPKQTKIDHGEEVIPFGTPRQAATHYTQNALDPLAAAADIVSYGMTGKEGTTGGEYLDLALNKVGIGGAEELNAMGEQAGFPKTTKVATGVAGFLAGVIMDPLSFANPGQSVARSVGKKGAEEITLNLRRYQKEMPGKKLMPGSKDVNELPGAEMQRVIDDPEAVPALNFYQAGQKPEAVVRDMPFVADAQVTGRFYDIAKDPEKIAQTYASKGGVNEIERQLVKQGYKGIIGEDKRVRVFGDVDVKNRYANRGRGKLEPIASEETNAVAMQIAKEVEQSGGASFSITGENMANAQKWAVSIYDETRQTLDKLEPQKVAAFIDKHKDLLSNPNHVVGAWVDDAGKVQLEVSVLTPDKNEALLLGKTFDQQGVYFLGDTGGTPNFLSTGGSGNPSKTIPDLAIRYPFDQRKLLLNEFRQTDTFGDELAMAARQVTDSLANDVRALQQSEPAAKDLTLDTMLPTNVLTMPSEVEKGFRQVRIKDLKEFAGEHTGDVEPEKVGKIQKDLSKVPPIVVEELADGTLKIADGRHRAAAALAEGYDTITAKVIRSKSADKALTAAEEAGPGVKQALSTKGMNQLAAVGAAVIHRMDTGAKTPYAAFRDGVLQVLPKEVSKLMTEKDIQKLFDKSLGTYERLVTNAVNEITSVKKISELAEKGDYLRSWYRQFRSDVEMIFGNGQITLPNGAVSSNAEMFTRFFAATSPQTAVNTPGHNNVELALKAFNEWKAGKPFSNDFEAHLGNLKRAAEGLPFSPTSPKVSNFFLNLWGDPNAVTVDTVIGEAFNFNLSGVGRVEPMSGSRYQFVQEVIRQEAALTGKAPDEYQAAVWVAAKELNPTAAATKGEVIETASASLRRILDQEITEHPELYQDLLSIRDTIRRINNNVDGAASLPATLLLARLTAGAAVGAYVGDEQNRIESMLIGIGMAATPETFKLAKKIADHFVKAKTLDGTVPMTPPPPLPKMYAWTPQQMRALYKDTRESIRPLTQVEEEADLLVGYKQVTRDTVADLYPGSTVNDATMRATQLVLKQSAEHVVHMAQTVDINDKAAVREVLKQLLAHGRGDIGRQIAETEAGRTLNVIDMSVADRNYLKQIDIAVDKLLHGASAERVISLLKQTSNPEHLTLFAAQTRNPHFAKMATEFWINGLLSSLRTLMVNPMTTGLFQLWNVGERAASVLYGNKTGPTEAMAMLRGMYEATYDSFILAANTLRHEQPHRVDAFGKVELSSPAITAEAVKNLPAMQAAGAALDPLVSRLEQYGPTAAALDYIGHAATAAVDNTGKLIRLPGRVLLAQDDFFKGIAFRAEVHAQAVREASAEVAAKNLTGDAARALYERVYNRVLKNPDVDTVARAKQFAAYSTFTKELGPAGKALQELAQSSIAAKMTLPFLLAPTNLLKTGFLERTPLGALAETFLGEIRKGGEEAQLAMTRMAVGTAFLSIASVWAAKGWITGGGPEDFNVLKQERQRGFVPYSVNLSKIKRDLAGEISPPEPRPGDEFIEYAKLDPTIAPALGMAANFAQIRGKLSDADALDLATSQGIALARLVSSKSWLSGAAGVTSMFADPEHGFDHFIKKQAGSWVPFSSLSGSVARVIDPVVRDPDTVTQAFLAKIPFASRTLIPDRNRYGEEVTYPPGLGPDIASPFYTNTYKADPTLDATKEDEIVLHGPKRYIQKTVLTDQEFDELRIIFGQEAVDAQGRTLREAEAAVIKEAKQSGHTTGPNSWRANELRRVDAEFKKKAQLILMRRHPDLAQAVLDDERERLLKLDKPAYSTLETDIAIADTDGIDVKRGKSKSQSIPFRVR